MVELGSTNVQILDSPMVKLSPCPFCRDTCPEDVNPVARWFDADGRNNTPWGVAVECPHCGARGPRFGTHEDAEEGWEDYDRGSFTPKLKKLHSSEDFACLVPESE